MTGARAATGLRLQIVLALAGLMLLAFVPLFFAVANLTRATVLDAREQAARALGRAIAIHVTGALASRGAPAMAQALDAQAGHDGVRAVCALTRDGNCVACAGAPADVADVRHSAFAGVGESATYAQEARGRALDVVASPGGNLTIVTRVALDVAAGRPSSLVTLVALYMVVFALALLVFAYFALTRLIVRPIDDLVRAADRVATGARSLHVPRLGARELVELGSSVQSMAAKLIAEEATLLVKVEELTETTSRLTRTQAQLVRSERMASVGRLAAGVAHEIGNPIAALMGMQDLLLDGDLSREAHTDFLERMRRETERIHAVVRDLLDFARPEADKGAGAPGIAPVPADVRAAVDDVVALVRAQRVFRAVSVETDVDPVPPVTLSASHLTQVLLNLLLNAGQALAGAARGGGRVIVRARSAEERVRIEVEDDGPGVAPDVRDRLFEPFATTKEVGEGTGLGLAVCRGLVEAAGGDIGLDAGYTAGARFYVVLPAGGSPRSG